MGACSLLEMKLGKELLQTGQPNLHHLIGAIDAMELSSLYSIIMVHVKHIRLSGLKLYQIIFLLSGETCWGSGHNTSMVPVRIPTATLCCHL